MLELFNTPIIISAIISGSIGALGIIIQWLNASTKSKSEMKSNFENTLKEKLEYIYTPLIMQNSIKNIEDNFVDDDILTLINKYGYLLSSELLAFLQELYSMETKGDSENYIEEYKNLRNKISKQANKEFKKLQNLYNSSFNTYIGNFTKPWYKQLLSSIIRSSLLITGIFWLVFICFYLLSKAKPIDGLTDNPTINFIESIIAYLIVITTLIAGLVIFLKIGFLVSNYLDKNKKAFASDEFVPLTGIYKCKACNTETVKYYKNGYFTSCSSNKVLHKIKASFLVNIWTLSTINVQDVINNHSENQLSS